MQMGKKAVKPVCMVKRSRRSIFMTDTDPKRRGTVNPEKSSRDGKVRVLTGAGRTSTRRILPTNAHFGYCRSNHLPIAVIDHLTGLSVGQTRLRRYTSFTTPGKTWSPQLPVRAGVPRRGAPLRLALAVHRRLSAGFALPTLCTS